MVCDIKKGKEGCPDRRKVKMDQWLLEDEEKRRSSRKGGGGWNWLQGAIWCGDTRSVKERKIPKMQRRGPILYRMKGSLRERRSKDQQGQAKGRCSLVGGKVSPYSLPCLGGGGDDCPLDGIRGQRRGCKEREKRCSPTCVPGRETFLIQRGKKSSIRLSSKTGRRKI